MKVDITVFYFKLLLFLF